MTQPDDLRPPRLTRRQALGLGVAGVAGVAGARAGGSEPSPREGEPRTTATARMPVVFLPHGGGPWPFVDLGVDRAEFDDLAGYLRAVAAVPPTPPRALLVISAHWEARVPTVMTSAQPAMYYDYYGFPPESYRVTWPAPGDPALAARVRGLLEDAKFVTAEDAQRGYDHGTFVPLKLAYPDARIPVVQLSLIEGLDPEAHLRMGRALAPLRDEGVFVIASGMTFHNLRVFMDPRARPIAETFDAWLRETMVLPADERDRRLAAWEHAPMARNAHPREEHLVPLLVAAGAAGADLASIPYSSTYMGLRLSAYHFGAA